METAIQACAAGATGVELCQCLEDCGRSVAGIKMHQPVLPVRRLTVSKADSARPGESVGCRI